MSGMSTYTPGMEISGGSLGHGLSIAVGAALGLRYQGSAARVYNFLSDGELDEGSTWEAAMGAHHHQLGNLTAMVDINALQADGKTDTVLRTEPVTEKWEAFGWYTQRVDGNDVGALLAAFDNAAAQAAAVGRPSVILCDTKVGRGVPLLEDREKAHFMRIEEHEWQICREQLTAGYEGKRRHDEHRHHTEAEDLGHDRLLRGPGPEDHVRAVRACPGQGRAGERQDRGTDRGPGQVHGHAHFRPGLPGTLLPDGHGRAAALRRRRRPGRDRPGPFASTYSVFAARRAYDFLCLDAAEPNLNVNIVGGLPGLTTGYGPSHQATEDMAIFRGMPNLTIVDPCDSLDIEQAVPQLAASEGPTYLRLLRGNVPTVLDEYDYTFELGKAKVLRGGRDVVFISSGLMTMRALQAAEALAAHHVDVAVVHAPTIKPFDAATVLAELNTDRLAVTLENHSVVGGLFETVASAVVTAGLGKRVVPVALPDEFLDAGALPTLHERYGLSVQRIVAKVLAELG